MKKPAPRQFAMAVLLAFALVVASTQAVSRLARWTIDFGRVKESRLSPETIEFFKTLDEPVFFTYVVTARSRMPSSLKRVERKTVAWLEALKRLAPDKVDYEILDPSDSPELAANAALKKVSPFHVGDVEADEKTERTVWSSLVISRGAHRDAVLHALDEEKAAALDRRIVGHLKFMKDPIRPTLAVSAPDGYGELKSALSEYGDVLETDFNKDPRIPSGADVFFWMEPQRAEAAQVRELRRFLATGRSVVAAGSLYRMDPRFREGTEEALFFPTPLNPAIENLARPFGLEFERRILFDERCETLMGGGREIKAPHLIATTPQTHNVVDFAGTSKGALRFAEASPIKWNDGALRAQGWEPTTVVTTTERAWTGPLSETPFTESDFAAGIYESKRPMAVLLTNEDPFFGKFFVLSSVSMFRDGDLSRSGYAHGMFLNLLAQTFLSADDLVKMRVERRVPAPLPEAGPAAIVFWRIFVLGLFPAAAVALAVVRGGTVAGWRRGAAFGRRAAWKFAASCLASAAVALGCVLVVRTAARGAQVDLTREKINSFSGATLDKLRSLKGGGPVTATLFFTARRDMPASMKRAENRAREMLGILNRRSGGRIRIRSARPEEASDLEKKALMASGAQPVRMEVMEFDSVRPRDVWSVMRLEWNGRTALAPPLREDNLGKMEFFLALGLETLARGRPVSLAVVTDLPRLSPAEAHEDYQKKQLIAPVGADVYSEAKDLFRKNGFETVNVDSKDPRLPARYDALVWFQPRRPHMLMSELLGKSLANGGAALVAEQHYNIQQRQYSGRSFETVYWPQPQYSDFNDYLNLIGINMEQEALMDSVSSQLALNTQINRSAVREHEKQVVSKPFLIRALPSNYDPQSPVTGLLGDLLFIWGNRFVADEPRLSALGLKAEPLVSTSARAWRYLWSGGFLGDEVFEKPKYLKGRQPLALLVRGTFPPVRLASAMGKGGEGPAAGEAVPALPPESLEALKREAESNPSAAFADAKIELDPDGNKKGRQGKLLLAGSSEMFKNQHLREPGFDHEKFLLNATAFLALGPDMARLQSKEPAARGFEPPPARSAQRFRALVLGLPPFLTGAFGAVWFLLRKRRSPYAKTGGPS